MNEGFNRRLRRLREDKRLTAAEMARRIEVPASTYREWENGRNSKFPPYLKISQVLAISVTELVTGYHSVAPGEIQQLEQIEAKLRELRLKLLALK